VPCRTRTADSSGHPSFATAPPSEDITRQHRRWASVLTVIFGAVLPGLVTAAAVGLGWLVWRYTAQSGGALEAGLEVADGRYGRVRPEHPTSGAHHGFPTTDQQPA
jgi:hypothetical protein